MRLDAGKYLERSSGTLLEVHSSGDVEENHEKHLSGKPVTEPKFEMGTFQMDVQSVISNQNAQYELIIVEMSFLCSLHKVHNKKGGVHIRMSVRPHISSPK